MENLWKVNKIRHQLNSMAERAEYDRLVESFQNEEQAAHRRNLLFTQTPLKNSDSRR